MTSALDRLAARLRRVERELLARKSPQLANSSVEDGALRVNAADGTTTMALGKQFDGASATVVFAGPTPPTPSPATTRPSVKGIVALWDGTFADALVAPTNFARVEVHVGPAGFDPLTANYLRGTIESPRGGEVIVPLAAPDEVEVVLVARSLSGGYGPASTGVLETPGVAVEPGTITETEIADDSISTPKLKAEAVTADTIAANAVGTDKLQANSVGADELKANIILASRIASGGTLAEDGTLSGQRTELSPLGLQAFDSGENITFKVANDGTAHQFTGDADMGYVRTSKGASLAGAVEVPQGAVATLNNGVTPPSVPPTIGGTIWQATNEIEQNHTGPLGDFPTYRAPNSTNTRVDVRGGFVDGTTAYVVSWLFGADNYQTFLGSRVTKYTIGSGAFSTSAATYVSCEDFAGIYVHGYVQLTGVKAWLWSTTYDGASDVYQVSNNNGAGGATTTRTYTRSDTATAPAFGWDYVNSKMLIAEWSSPIMGISQVRNVTRWGTGASPVDLAMWQSEAIFRNTNSSPNCITGVAYGRFDFAGDTMVMTTSLRRFSTSGLSQPSIYTDTFEPGGTLNYGKRWITSAGTIAWDGSVFRIITDRTGNVGRHADHQDEVLYPDSSNQGYMFWWIGLSYVNTTGSTINNETELGAVTKAKILKRGFVGVSTPALPSSGVTPAPTQYRVYTAKGDDSSTIPAVSAFHDDGLAPASSYYYHTMDAVGSAPLSVGTFPGGGAPGKISSAAGDGSGAKVQLAGDGAWRLGQMSGTADGKNNVWETGDYKWSARTSPTAGWLLVDASEKPIATYTDLYNVLTNNGTVFPYGANTNGSGAAGSTHFRLPPPGKVLVSRDPAQTEFDTMGEQGGAKTVTLTAAQSGLRKHAHPLNMKTTVGTHDANDGAVRGWNPTDDNFRSGLPVADSAYASASVSDSDALQSHQNMPPYVVGNLFIKT